MRLADEIEVLQTGGGSGALYPVLVWDNEHVVLIDAGYPLQTEAIRKGVEAAGLALSDIDTIILTHQDIDHIGCVKEIQAEAAKPVTVIAHEIEAPYIDGRETPIKMVPLEKNKEHLPEELKARYIQLKEGFENRRIPIDKTVRDGAILPYVGGIRVIHTPGHTPGHICLYLEQSRVCVCGDALNINGGKLTGPNPQFTYDLEEGIRSLERLKEYDIDAIVAYHGGVYRGPLDFAY